MTGSWYPFGDDRTETLSIWLKVRNRVMANMPKEEEDAGFLRGVHDSVGVVRNVLQSKKIAAKKRLL